MKSDVRNAGEVSSRLRLAAASALAGAVCGAVLLGAATAQVAAGVSEGPLLGVPHAMSVATLPVIGTFDPTAIYLKDDGFLSTAPAPWVPAAGLPDWSASAILQGVTPRPDIDALSIGFDWVVSDGNGVAVVPPGHWAGLTLSVTPATLGRDGGVIRAETRRGDGAAGDVFNYNLPGSALPPELVDRTMRAQDSTEINVHRPGAPADLDAHDVYIALVYAQNPQLLPLLPAALTSPQRVFFSVSDATKARVPSAWWAGSTPSGATVFCASWTGSAWTVPAPFLLHSDLGLLASEDLDALAVDVLRNEMLFSTKSPARDPLLWATGFGGHPAPITVRTYTAPSGGGPIAGRIGLLTGDDVDAVCALDPGADPVLQRVLGRPQTLPFPIPQPSLSASVLRDFTQTGGEHFKSYMAGWPPQTGIGPGFAGGFLGLLAPTGWLPLQVLPSNQRTPSNPFAGDPRVVDVPIPGNVSTLGLPVFFWWLVADQSLGDIGIGQPLRVNT